MPHTLAYVLIRAASGQALNAAEKLRGLGVVKQAYAVTGTYDIICLVEAESLEALANTVVEQIQQVPGVERTETALAVHTH